MAQFNMPNDVSVDAFFTEIVPSQFGQITAGANLSSLAGKEITLQYQVGGEKYCLKIKDGKDLEVIKGGIDKPMLTLSLSEENWRSCMSGNLQGVIDRFADPIEIADPNRLNTLAATKGTLNVDLKQADGASLPISMVFNGEDKPAVSINLDLQDWVSMQKREVTGQALFMNGRLKFTGDMVLLMKLQTLM